MKTRICKLFAAILLLGALPAMAAPPTQVGIMLTWTGTGVDANNVLFTATAEDGIANVESCEIVSTTGSVKVYVSADGTTYTNTGYSLTDYGATDNNPVVATAALRPYAFPVNVRGIKVVQVGDTASAASMTCKIANVR